MSAAPQNQVTDYSLSEVGPAKTQPKKKRNRAPVRYSVRIERAGEIQEIGIGTDLKKEIDFAERYHTKHGLKIWVWNVRTGVTLHRIERDGRARRAGGAS